MDPVSNPYSPGAGWAPPALAGRDKVREQVRVSIERIRRGKPTKNVMMVGLRGVGKTVLLDRMLQDAAAANIETARLEAPEERSLPALLAPKLRLSLLRLSRIDAAKSAAERALRILAGFVNSLKVTFSDIEVGLDFDPLPGFGDNGDLEEDLPTLFAQVGEAARRAGTALVLFIDELQYVEVGQLGALIAALHRCSQLKLPLTLVAAGLPQLRARAGEAKSYAERLFAFPEIGPLAREDAEFAIVKPASDEGVAFAPQALEAILAKTRGYPYFLQEWGKHSWNIAQTSPITEADVTAASTQAIAELDESFFRVRFDRLTPREKHYLRAMAELGEGPHRSGDIAAALKRKVSSLGPLREKLISKGMIWSPTHGDTAFTVPLFDEFMRRIMPIWQA